MSIATYILKVASRCNLNCSYCYLYNMGDTTYKNQPKFMSLENVAYFAAKLNSYCISNDLKLVFIAFHGGEPTMVGKEFFKKATKIINDLSPEVKKIYTIQTNGTTLDDEWCSLFKSLDIQVSISVDGPKKTHNEFRKYHNGKGSFDDVIKGIHKRNEFDRGGLISVVNLDIDPQELYDFYKQVSAVKLNLLLPEAHFDSNEFVKSSFKSAKYGNWLIGLYDLWKQDQARPSIPFFESIVKLILGEDAGDELIGNRSGGVACIESNGAIEVIDPLRVCGNGFTRNSLNVRDNNIEDLEALELYQIYYDSHKMLSSQCDNCLIKGICGGGYLVHRYSKLNGFDNPTVYCKDYIKIICHIQNDVIDEMPDQVREEFGLVKFFPNEVLEYNKEKFKRAKVLNSEKQKLRFFRESSIT